MRWVSARSVASPWGSLVIQPSVMPGWALCTWSQIVQGRERCHRRTLPFQGPPHRGAGREQLPGRVEIERVWKRTPGGFRILPSSSLERNGHGLTFPKQRLCAVGAESGPGARRARSRAPWRGQVETLRFSRVCEDASFGLVLPLTGDSGVFPAPWDSCTRALSHYFILPRTPIKSFSHEAESRQSHRYRPVLSRTTRPPTRLPSSLVRQKQDRGEV